MPTYAYTCRDCGRALEAHQDFSDASLTVCPTCGGRLRKQYGSIGVAFNGSGFYRNDSRAESAAGSAQNKSESSKSDAGSSGSSDSGSSGSKPETKSDSAPSGKPAESTLAKAASAATSGPKASTKSD